ncbi:MAG: SPOR domain-containing protein [Deltaproteobacteria bacterium]|nr:SPOR domain-containing protein [Deltaproteobacteria bacterium]
MNTDVTNENNIKPVDPADSLLPTQLKTPTETGQMVERILKTQATFFDHYRLKNLGGQFEPSEQTALPRPNPGTVLALKLRPIPPSENVNMVVALPFATKDRPKAISEGLGLPSFDNGTKALESLLTKPAGCDQTPAEPKASGSETSIPEGPKTQLTKTAAKPKAPGPETSVPEGQKTQLTKTAAEPKASDPETSVPGDQKTQLTKTAPAAEAVKPLPSPPASEPGPAVSQDQTAQTQKAAPDDLKPDAQAAKAKPAKDPAAESKVLLTVKWLTRLCLSIIFLVWVFILGFLIGRGKLADAISDLSPFGKTEANTDEIQAMALSDFNDDLVPPKGYPVVIEQYETDEPADAWSSPQWVMENGALTSSQSAPNQALTALGDSNKAPGSGQQTQKTDPLTASAAPAASTDDQGRTDGASRPEANSVTPEVTASSPKTEVPAGNQPAEPKNPNQTQAASTSPPAGAPGNNQVNPSPLSAAASRPQNANSPAPGAKTDIPNAATPSQTMAASNQDYFWPEKPKSTGKFTVQVASPTTESEAKAIAEQYLTKGFEAYYYHSQNGRHFPVRVGRYDSEAQANAAKELLAAAGANQPYVSKLNH